MAKENRKRNNLPTTRADEIRKLTKSLYRLGFNVDTIDFSCTSVGGTPFYCRLTLTHRELTKCEDCSKAICDNCK